jgi:glycosyltransferase involved in cell wall biosynthesis
MRIAMLSWESSKEAVGVARHVAELSAALQPHSQVDVFTRLCPTQNSLPDFNHDRGVTYHFIPGFSDFSTEDILKNIDSVRDAFINTFLEVETKKGGGKEFQVVHGHEWKMAPILKHIKTEINRPCVFTMHSTEYGHTGATFHLNKDSSDIGSNSQKIIQLEKEGALYADGVIALSNTVKSELVTIYGIPESKIHIVYNGISFLEFDGFINPEEIKRRYDIGGNGPVVLFVGHMIPQKGPDLLLEAIPETLRFKSETKFIFVGDGDLKKILEDRAKDLDVSNDCRFLGCINRPELINIFKASHCVVVPSRYEPAGTVILEAWSTAKPVVATLNGFSSEIIWHDVTGFKIPPKPESIAWGITELLRDSDHASWIGEQGYNAVKSVFSWELVASHSYDVYRTVRKS